MKKYIKFGATAAILTIVLLAVSACSGNWEPPYSGLDKSGYTVSVKFDANGGVFAGTNDVSIIDVYNLNDVTNGNSVYLLSPDDSIRAEGAFEISRNGYFLAGWYTDRQLRVDENGNALDEYGVLTSVSGRSQGYTYSGKWEFETDKFSYNGFESLTSYEPVCTLYAAWIPYFTFEFYAEDEAGQFALFNKKAAINLDIPSWNQETGKLDYNSFPEREGYTAEAWYLDAEKENILSERINGAESFVNYETGTTDTETVKIYTTWLDGIWYKIYNAKQFVSNSRLDGNYILCADLDFTDAFWSKALAEGKFSGKIIGNGYKMSNIKFTQNNNSQMFGGLFGMLNDGAVLENVIFENITYELYAGSRMQGATFGLLAGTVSEKTTISDISVSGNIIVDKNCYPQNGYIIGLIFGSGTAQNVDLSNIGCSVKEDAENITVETDESGSVTIVFN